MIDVAILMQAVMDSNYGVTISDASLPDKPLIFVNTAFEEMTGYSREEVVNRNCSFLHGKRKNQRNIDVITKAISNADSCSVTIPNYRKDGSLFWNELSISPLFGSNGKATHFIGVHNDITGRIKFEQLLENEHKTFLVNQAALENLVTHDSLTGIYNRRYFETQFEMSSQHLLKPQGSLTLLMVDVDYFKLYNDTYGHSEGDNVLIKIASTLAGAMKRSTDFVARYGGEEFILLSSHLTRKQAVKHAKNICEKVRALDIPHETSSHGFVTISCGIAHVTSMSKSNPDALLQQADTALYRAKASGRNQAIILTGEAMSMGPTKVG